MLAECVLGAASVRDACGKMKGVFRLAIVVLIAVAAGLAPAERSIHRVETEHYHVRTDVGRQFTELVGQHMEAIYKAYTSRFGGYKLKVHEKFVVRVFARQADYNAAVPDKLRGSAGGFISADKMLLSYKESRTDEEVFRTLYHEGFHQFLYSSIAQECPLWVNEGLAEYFSEATWNGRRFTTGQVPVQRLHVVQSALKAGKHIPLEVLFRTDSDQWFRNIRAARTRASLQYCEAWSVVHFLIHASGGRHRPRLLDYLRRISEGMDHGRAFEKSFGSDVKSFERAWADYVMELKPGLDQLCRRNLEILGVVALDVYGTPRQFTSLSDLRRALKDKRVRWTVDTSYGEKINSDDTRKVASLFKCPYDKGRGRTSYVLLKEARTGLPVLFCNHHRGVVLKAYFVPSPHGGYEMEVEQQVRATLPRELLAQLRSPSEK